MTSKYFLEAFVFLSLLRVVHGTIREFMMHSSKSDRRILVSFNPKMSEFFPLSLMESGN